MAPVYSGVSWAAAFLGGVLSGNPVVNVSGTQVSLLGLLGSPSLTAAKSGQRLFMRSL